MTIDEVIHNLRDAISTATGNDPAVQAAIAAFEGVGFDVALVALQIQVLVTRKEAAVAESNAEFLLKLHVSPYGSTE